MNAFIVAILLASANQFYEEALVRKPKSALFALMGLLTGKFQEGGPWDYKNDYVIQIPKRLRLNFWSTSISERFGIAWI